MRTLAAGLANVAFGAVPVADAAGFAASGAAAFVFTASPTGFIKAGSGGVATLLDFVSAFKTIAAAVLPTGLLDEDVLVEDVLAVAAFDAAGCFRGSADVARAALG